MKMIKSLTCLKKYYQINKFKVNIVNIRQKTLHIRKTYLGKLMYNEKNSTILYIFLTFPKFTSKIIILYK